MATNDKAQRFWLTLDQSANYGLWSLLNSCFHICYYKFMADHVLRREFRVMDHEMENEFPFLLIQRFQVALLSAWQLLPASETCISDMSCWSWYRETASTRTAGGAAVWLLHSFFLCIILLIVPDDFVHFYSIKIVGMTPGCLCTLSIKQC